MVMLIFVHMTAHFLTGSYKYPRELQWLTGSVLLILTLAMAFTGQLLRWNQDAYWAIVVGAEQAARDADHRQVGRATLARRADRKRPDTHPRLCHPYLAGTGRDHHVRLDSPVSRHLQGHLRVAGAGQTRRPQDVLGGVSGDPPQRRRAVLPGRRLEGCRGQRRAHHPDHCARGDRGWVSPRSEGEPHDARQPGAGLVPHLVFRHSGANRHLAAGRGHHAVRHHPAPRAGLPGVLFLFPLANKGERHYSRRPWAVATVLIMAVSTALLLYLGYSEPWKPQLGASGDTVPSLPKYSYAKLPSSAQRGAQLMHGEACLACHMVGNFGASQVSAVGSTGSVTSVGGTRGPDLSAVADQLTRDQLIYRIARGGGGMPAYGSVITPKELTDLVNYLETRSQEHAPPPNNSVSANSP